MLVTDGKPTVARIKAELIARGVTLAGPCGAFEITKRVAWLLRETGAGLNYKPQGNNCEGYSVDVVIWLDGQYVDMLIDSGGANEPAWQIRQGDPSVWRAPIDPGDVVTPPAPVPPAPDPAPPTPEDEQDAFEWERFIAALERIADGVEGICVAAEHANEQRDAQHKEGTNVNLKIGLRP